MNSNSASDVTRWKSTRTKNTNRQFITLIVPVYALSVLTAILVRFHEESPVVSEYTVTKCITG